MPSTSFDPDALPFRRALIVAVACVGAVVAGAMLADQPYLIFAGLAGLVYVGTLTVNCRVLAWLVIALQPAALIVPFFPGRPFWWELCALLAWPSLLAYGLVNRRKIEVVAFDRAERWALAALGGYVAVILGTMAYRGVGLRVLGGEQMGGRVYVQQLVLAILPVLMILAGFTRRQLCLAMIAGWVLSLTYLVSEFTFARSGEMETVLYFFELPTDGLNFSFGYNVSGVRRFGSLAAVASAGLACLWVMASMRELLGRWLLITCPLMIGLLGLGLGSGYRNVLATAVVTFFCLTLFQRFWDFRRVLAAVVVVGGMIATLYAFADQLPLSVQRSVSFFPGLDISPVAKADAATTNSDRVEVIKRAAADVPRYWLTGRGFGMDRFDRVPVDSNDSVSLLYSQGMFYNGFIGTLLKLGIPGLLFSLAFIWNASRMALELRRMVSRRSSDTWSFFDRLCLLLCAQWFAAVVLFYLTNGDVTWWMQYFGLSAGLIMACRRLQQSGDAELVGNDVEPNQRSKGGLEEIPASH
ncbi:MAG: hypothetical protein QM760_14500 [Nibricoccus sp.]